MIMDKTARVGVKKTVGTLCVLLLVLAVARTHAQNITSSIVGQVLDTAGASLPAAQITVKNEQTGVSVQGTSDSGGMYSVPNLLPGLYKVTASKHGFQTSTTTGIQVQSSRSVRVNVTLQVGAVQQEVTVTGSAPLLHTESQTIGTTLTARQISELPVPTESIGGLLSLAAGSPYATTFPLTSGATNWGSHNFTLNGVTVNDPGNGTGAYSYAGPSVTFINLPPIESMQEFAVDSVDMKAESRSVASVTMVTKQGTNQFHGEAYEYLQNSVLNATPFILNAYGQANPQSPQHQFGGNIGGPIKKDKAWFFFNFGGYRERSYSPFQANFPSMPMRKGDFSSLCSNFTQGVCAPGSGTQLYNPLTGQPFLNNSIPQSMITPQAQALLKFLPATTVGNTLGLPNGPVNYVGTVGEPNDMDSYVGRIDYQLSKSDTLFAVFDRSNTSPWGVFEYGTPAAYGNASNFGNKDVELSATETHTFSPTTINDIRLSWFDHASIRKGQNTDFNPTSLFPQLTPGENRGLPTTHIGGYSGMFYDYGNGFYDPSYDVEVTENFTHIHGAHTIKAGIDETGYKIFRPSPFGSLGSFGFSGQWTGNKGWPGQPSSQGNAFADFLLGDANNSSKSPPGTSNEGFDRDWELYAQDSWQTTAHLTLNYGLRYVYQTPWRIRDYKAAYLDFNTNKLLLPQTGPTPVLPPGADPTLFADYPYETTAAAGIPRNYFLSDTNNLAPRFGFAYRPPFIAHTVLRGGYGIYYNFAPYYAGFLEPSLNPPYGSGGGGVFGGISYNTQLPGKPTAPFLPDLTFANPFPSAAGTALTTSHPNVYAPERNLVNAQIQQWNLTLEHQFGASWMGRASYVGSKSDHLPWVDGNINIPLTQTPNVQFQNQLPLQPWNAIRATRAGGKASFNELQLEATKRFSRGLTFQAQYQWNRGLDNVPIPRGAPERWQFPNLDYGNTDSIPRQVLVFNYVWDLPFGQGRLWLSHLSKPADMLLGGWEASGITTYSTGSPFSVDYSIPSNFTGWFGGRADRVSGVPLYAGQRSGSHDIVNGVPWFNPAAFGPPQPWTWGDSARNTVWGPGFWNWDMSARKNFTLTERAHLQVRADFFDAFNHFNLGGPNSTVADTRDGGLPITTAGEIFGGFDSRIIQVGLRLTF